MPSAIVSIILPYFNAEKTLRLAAHSILHQTFKDLELILVNNNSTDGSHIIAEELAHKDSRIKLSTEPRQGVVFAANTAMKLARGKYLARMDADDVAHSDRIMLQYEHLESNPHISISATQVNYKSNQSDGKNFNHFVRWSNSLSSWDKIYDNRFVEFPLVNPTLMFRKSTLEDVGYLKEGRFPEDYEWFLRAVDQGHRIEKLTIPLLDWYDHSTRLTRTDPRYNTDAFFQIKIQHLAGHLKAINQNKVWIWGAGKLGLKRSKLLIEYGIDIQGYIDIKKGKRISQYSCVHFKDIDLSQQPFVISFITNRNRRDEIRHFLNQRSYAEGKNYIIAG